MDIRKVGLPFAAAGILASGCAPSPETNPTLVSTIEWSGFPNDPQEIYAETFPAPSGEQPLVINLPGGGARLDTDGDGVEDDGGALCNTSETQTRKSAEFFQNLGYASIAVDKPIYPAPDPFCKNPGQDIAPYMEAFDHYQDIIEDTVVFAQKHKEVLGWDGERIALAGYSFGATAALNTLRTEFVPDAIIATSGFLTDGELPPGSTKIMLADYEQDTGFAGFEKPNPTESCNRAKAVGNTCDNITLEGAGHAIFPHDTLLAIDNDYNPTTVAEATSVFIRKHTALNQ